MSWDWAWAIDSLTLADVCSAVVLEDEGGGSWADSPYRIPGRDGVFTDPDSPWGPMTLVLKMVLRYTDKDGAITHTNGAAGHVKENLSKIKAALSVPGERVLKRTDPHAGNQQALVKLLTDPIAGNSRERFVYRFVLLCPSGSWEDAAATTQDAASVSTSGDRRIFDPIIDVGGAGNLTYTSLDGTAYEITAVAGPTYPVTIDVGAGTIVDDASADASGAVTFTHHRWLVLDPARNQGLGGSAAGSSSVTYRNRWG